MRNQNKSQKTVHISLFSNYIFSPHTILDKKNFQNNKFQLTSKKFVKT